MAYLSSPLECINKNLKMPTDVRKGVFIIYSFLLFFLFVLSDLRILNHLIVCRTERRMCGSVISS